MNGTRKTWAMGVRDSTVLVLTAMRFDTRASVRASQADATRVCKFSLYAQAPNIVTPHHRGSDECVAAHRETFNFIADKWPSHTKQSFCLWSDCSLTRVAYKNYISLCAHISALILFFNATLSAAVAASEHFIHFVQQRERLCHSK